jgi:hypothetical protein
MMRIHRHGHVIQEGVNHSMEIRAEVPLRVDSEGEIAGTGGGVGETLNDYSPYSLDVCRLDVRYRAIGGFTPNCELQLQVFEEILSGSCTHFDPFQSFSYEYGVVGVEEDFGWFIFSDTEGKTSRELETYELEGKVHWVNEYQVWVIQKLPICNRSEFDFGKPEDWEPWPTPTWQP